MDRWISFDCYGTLIDWQKGMSHSLEIVAPSRSLDLMRHHRQVEGEIELERPILTYREVLARSVRQMADIEEVNLYPGDEHILAATLPFWNPYADTGPSLAAIKALGWRICILSNVDRDLIAQTLEHFPVEIDMVITAEDVGSYKPAPAHFEEFRRRTGDAEIEWVHAAVNLEYDLVPTSAMGATTIWINRERETGRETAFLHRELPDMTELAGTLAKLGATAPA
ncbi:MAG: HAD family hydrolase [Sphingomonas sp.]|jgi:2-haloacid dehalogenase|uniref:HAD family hydrolase n=1 Tax=Sphingomonas sp. TaxID=28214 RepID=UPI0035682C97